MRGADDYQAIKLGGTKPERETLDRWAAEEKWCPEHAVMLAFGRDPDRFPPSVGEGSGESLVPPNSLLRKARDALESGLLSAECRPVLLIAWARQQGITFHPDWTDRLFADFESAKREIESASWALRERADITRSGTV